MVLGFYHLYAALATDERFAVEEGDDDWEFSERYSAWTVEQMIRHHERDFGEFERIDASPEEFHAGGADGGTDDEPDGTDEHDESDGEDAPAASESAD